MIPDSVDIDAFFVTLYLSFSLTNTQYLNLLNIKLSLYFVFVGIFLEILLDQYFRGRMGEENSAKNS